MRAIVRLSPHDAYSDIAFNRTISMRTILITGTSSGYGLATAQHFLGNGWRVIATMRTPRTDVLPASPNLQILHLDVTDAASIATAVDAAGPIDVLVNNAGIGAMGAFEATPMSTVRELFEANTFGVMAMTQAFIPQFRARRAGLIVNVSSSSTLGRFPLVAAYTATKMAVNGFTGSLALELAEFNVQVKLVEPGYGPDTRFTANGEQRMAGLIPEAYQPFAARVFGDFARASAVPTAHTSTDDVARSVWRAVHDTTGQLRFPAGADAIALAQARI